MSKLQIIKDWYSQYPFPGPYKIDQINDTDCLHNKFIKNINEYCNEKSTVLDVGCGTGLFLNALAIHNPNCKFKGIDFSDGVQYAQQFAHKHKITNVEYEQLDLFDLDTSTKYDVVIAQSVLTHIEHWQKALEVLKDLVNNNGILIVSIYSPFGKMLQKVFPKSIKNDRLALDQYSNPLDVTVPRRYFVAGTCEFSIVKEIPSNYHNGGLTVYNLEKQALNYSVKEDIHSWLINYVEKPHEFYNFEFSPCPFAKKIRIQNDMITKAYNTGSFMQFVNYNIDLLLQSDKTVLVMFAPNRFNTWLNRKRLKNINKRLVPLDRYLQVGEIPTSYSKYDNSKGYFGIFLNRLSKVIDAQKYLESTNFYDNWTEEHHNIVVKDREKLANKYAK